MAEHDERDFHDDEHDLEANGHGHGRDEAIEHSNGGADYAEAEVDNEGGDVVEPDDPPPENNRLHQPTHSDPTRTGQMVVGPGEFDDEGEGVDGQVAGTPPKNQYEKDDDDNAARRYALPTILVLVLIFALLLILGLLFRQDNTPVLHVVAPPTSVPSTGTEITGAPVGSLTNEPTLNPTNQPTPNPTPVPTPGGGSTAAPAASTPTASTPTIAPFTPTISSEPQPLSRLPCAEITANPNVTANNLGEHNFQVYNLTDGYRVCADTYGGFDPSRPNRNVWTATIGRRDCALDTYQNGTKICESVGARRCTANELSRGAGQGSGCGGDNNYVYSSTTCKDENGAKGYVLVNIEFKIDPTLRSALTKCESNFTMQTSATRCCGDIDVPGHEDYASVQLPEFDPSEYEQ